MTEPIGQPHAAASADARGVGQSVYSANVEQAVLAEQVQVLYRSPLAMLANLVLAPTVVVLVGDFYPPWLSALWLLAFFILVPWRTLDWRAYQRHKPAPEEAERWLARFTTGALLMGCLWGLAASLVFLVSDPTYYIYIGFAAMCITAAAIAAYSVHLPTFFVYTLPAVLPVVGALLWRGTPVSIGVALAAVLFGILLIVIGLDFNDALVRSFRFKVERASLARELAVSRDKAEADSRAKSEFLAHLSHELRTPLNAIIGFSEMFMSERFGAMPSPEYLNYSRYINESAQHLLELIKRVLDMMKAEAGALVIDEDQVDLGAVIESCLHMVEKQAAAEGVTLQVSVPPGFPSFRGDPGRMRQVIINLLSNAIKFTPKGGMVHIEARLEPNNAIRILVSDTGIGIREEDIPRALMPFVQLDDLPRRRAEGAGLGLPLAKQLVELHGGAFEVASKHGEGTQVSIRLPPERTVPTSPTA